MVSALAIVCARNEAVHIARCLSGLIASGCEVVLIDNESTDETLDQAQAFLGKGLLSIERLAWRGAFSLSDQLRAKNSIIAGSKHDWIVHADADEWLISPVAGQTLLQAIAAADGEGSNVINFHECVFLPKPGEDFYGPDYALLMRDYYFFQPHYPRLNRASKRSVFLSNLESGGHLLAGGEVRRYARDLILRHYIVLSQEHANAKYLGRTFSEEDLGRKWHGNRLIIDEANLRLRTHPDMRRLASPLAHDYDLSLPLREHFWEWPA